MIYSDLINEVYVHTNRPDLTAETATAVRKATLKLHGTDFYKNDYAEVVLAAPVPVVGTSDFRYALDLSSISRLRSLSFVREYLNPPTGLEKQFEAVEPDQIMDSYGWERLNVFYRAGTTLNIRANKAITNFKVGHFLWPNIVPASYSSWIASEFPDAIIEEAAATVFKMIGKDEEYQRYAQLLVENIHILQMSQVETIAR